jgi:hypothetical protein
METPQWKSPRKIEEEVRAYRSKRFEDYMKMEDRGEIERSIAITALREEIAYSDQVTEMAKNGNLAA